MGGPQCHDCPKGMYRSTATVGDTECTIGCKSNAEYWEGIASSALQTTQIATVVGLALWAGLRKGGGGAQNVGQVRRDLNPDVAALVQRLEAGKEISAVEWQRHDIVPVYHQEHDITVNLSPYGGYDVMMGNVTGSDFAPLVPTEAPQNRVRRYDSRSMSGVHIGYAHYNYDNHNSHNDPTFGRDDANRMGWDITNRFMTLETKVMCFCFFDTAYGGQAMDMSMHASMGNGKWQAFKCPSCAVGFNPWG
ncbi:hypothetical protein IE53DRAFT_384117 [Violaceomyces palustris]|uniref:Uncharacterized protein n=1 Tax=Violaceomyces palustris TaxID=1673888 RepID=A0ACD0P5U8_9BASI|nr:hypothetical protein IE53DRAFT_384117 [Violaceomyces palustris]